MNPGDIIRRERGRLGWTVYRLAAESGLHASQIARAESGARSLTLESTRKLCAALGVSLAVFDRVT